MLKSALLLMVLSGKAFADSSPAIRIDGDERFVLQVRACLDLLSRKAKLEYRLVRKYVGVISQGNRSGMFAWEDPPRFQMSDKTAFYSLTWCAGSIVHDAYHSFLYQKYLPDDGSRTVGHKWSGFTSEKQAIQRQLRVLKKLDAAMHEINHLKTQDGTHGDLNGDGKLTIDDFNKRDW